MGALKDKVSGILNIGAGRIKQGVSHDTADRNLENQGANQELKGKAQKKVGEVKEAAGNVIHKIGSKIKRAG